MTIVTDRSICRPSGASLPNRMRMTSEFAEQPTGCTHVRSAAHSLDNKYQCHSAGNRAFKQPAKCMQELLALRNHSVNPTRNSDYRRNGCHWSVHLLIHECL